MTEQRLPPPSGDLLPLWSDLVSDYIEPGVPALCVVRRTPELSLFVDADGARFGAWIEMKDNTSLPSSPLSEISVSPVQRAGTRFLEIATSSRSLYREFYLLLGEFITAVITEGVAPLQALAAILDRWRTLLRATLILSEEQQIGLFGELWMFARLLPALGASTLDSWVGPASQVHDFRFRNLEFEVKTTSSARRTHIINGLTQLSPSQGCYLYLLSLQYIAAGAGGQTLPETINAIEARIAKFAEGPKRFAQLLQSVGYSAADAQYYSARRRIGGPPRLIPIADGCPRLTRAGLDELRPIFAPARIIDATYRIDVEGLGYADGDRLFLSILPATPETSGEGS
jgi:hypothetical protein